MRASSRVPALIASGNSQFYLTIEHEAYRKGLNKAKEIQGLLESACHVGYIAEQDFEKLNEQTNEICRMINGMRKKITNEIEEKRNSG